MEPTTAPRLLQVRGAGKEEEADHPEDGPGDAGRRELAASAARGRTGGSRCFSRWRGRPPGGAAGDVGWPAVARGQARPTIRTYTVRRLNAAAGELDVDFVLHEGHGPAAAWARDARPGVWVGVSEPGGRYAVDPEAQFHLVIGDESALPAVATVLDGPSGRRARIRLPGGRGPRRGAGTARRDDRVLGAPRLATGRWTPDGRRPRSAAPRRPRAGVAGRRIGCSATCAGTCSTTASWTAARCTRRGTGAPAEPAGGPAPLHRTS